MPPCDRRDTTPTFVEATHHGVVIATGTAAAEQVGAAVAESGTNCWAAGGGGLVVTDTRDLRNALRRDPDVIGYTGVLDGEVLDTIAAAVLSGTRVYVATQLRFDDVRKHLLDHARAYCNGHDPGMSIVPFN